MGKRKKKKKIIIDFEDDIYGYIWQLKDDLGCSSREDVFRQALLVMGIANEAHKDGDHLGILGPGNEILAVLQRDAKGRMTVERA